MWFVFKNLPWTRSEGKWLCLGGRLETPEMSGGAEGEDTKAHILPAAHWMCGLDRTRMFGLSPRAGSGLLTYTPWQALISVNWRHLSAWTGKGKGLFIPFAKCWELVETRRRRFGSLHSWKGPGTFHLVSPRFQWQFSRSSLPSSHP